MRKSRLRDAQRLPGPPGGSECGVGASRAVGAWKGGSAGVRRCVPHWQDHTRCRAAAPTCGRPARTSRTRAPQGRVGAQGAPRPCPSPSLRTRVPREPKDVAKVEVGKWRQGLDFGAAWKPRPQSCRPACAGGASPWPGRLRLGSLVPGPPPPGPQGLRHVPRADTGRVAPRPLHIAFPSILYQARSLRGPGPQLTATGHTWQRAAGGPVGGRLQPAARGWLPLLPQVLTEGGKREAPVLTPNPSQARKPTGHTSLEGQGSAFGSASRGPQPRAPDAGPGALDRKEAGEPAQPSGGHCRWSMWGWGPLSCRGGGGLHLQRRLVGGVH